MRRSFETASKLTVVASAALALALETRMGWSVWRELPYWTFAALALGGVGSRWAPAITWPALLASVPLFPVVVYAAMGQFPAAFHAIWFAALLGALLLSRDTAPRQWSFPAPWRAPLACWATVVAVTWPIAAWREIDFSPSLSAARGFGANALSGNGGVPAEVLGWVTTIVLAQLAGLLFFDWASASARRLTRDQFRARIVWPAAAGCVVAAALACYQGTIDIRFLNTHQWPELGRAGGGLLDGDASGALMGLWVAGFIALALSGRRATMLGALAGAVLSGGGLWSTGSRMALLSGLISLVGLGFVMWRFLGRRLRWIVVGGLVLAALATMVVARNRAEHNDPLQRALADLPAPNAASIATFARTQLFDRTGPYGTVSVRMMKEYPAGGVGLGSFETLFPDFAFEHERKSRYWKDNAQSWYRSQLAELGILGSVGWLLWLAMFGVFLWRLRVPAERRAEAALVRTAFVAIGVVALVAMPTRNVFVGFSVWIFAAWAVALARDDAHAEESRFAGAVNGRFAWALVLLIPLAAAADLWRTGHGDLRPLARAQRAAWNYEYGVFPVETLQTGEPYRWTSAHMAAVVQLERMAYLRIAIRGGPQDMATRPFSYTLRVRGVVIGTFSSPDGAPRVWNVQTRLYESDIAVEIETNRPWSGTDFGGTDGRELGVIIEPWALVDAPDPGATMIK